MDASMLLSMPLPPPWKKEDVDGCVHYINDVSGARTETHPFYLFLNANSNNESVDSGDRSIDTEEARVIDDDVNQPDPNQLAEPDGMLQNAQHHTGAVSSSGAGRRGEVHYDYHCQWSERDAFGKVILYGLTLRVVPDDMGKIYIKFDGMAGQWEYAALKGPYGSLELHDLFIGAKLNVFGRHLSISSANHEALRWIDKEQQHLMKQQENFRKLIERVGQVPVVRRPAAKAVQHITRDVKTKGQVNLRNLLKDNAKLGEQLASLGLTSGKF